MVRPKPRIDSSAPRTAFKIKRIKKRRVFLICAGKARSFTRGMVVQGHARGDCCTDVRVGFTCTKKLGNAVARNRAKRRLREIARLHLPGLAQSGWDYVLIGKNEITAQRDFNELARDFERALHDLHNGA